MGIAIVSSAGENRMPLGITATQEPENGRSDASVGVTGATRNGSVSSKESDTRPSDPNLSGLTTVFYAGGKQATGDPASLPRTGVLLIIAGDLRLHSADFYVWNPELMDWGICHCRCIADEHREKGNVVFSGEWVSKEEWKSLWETI